MESKTGHSPADIEAFTAPPSEMLCMLAENKSIQFCGYKIRDMVSNYELVSVSDD
jgi:hypothetical protein